MVRTALIALMLACGSTTNATETPNPTQPTETTEPASMAERVDTWATTNASGVELTIDEGSLHVHCPIGVLCDRSFDYFAVKGGSPRVYLSFDPAVLDNVTLESLRGNFRYMNFSVPAFEDGSWKVVLQPSGLSRREANEVTIDGYDNGRIQLTLRTTASELSAVDTSCQVPADAPMPAACFEHRAVEIPVVIHVDLPMPNQGVDCTNGGASCG